MLIDELKIRSPAVIWITACLTGLLLFTDVFQSFKYNLQMSLRPKVIERYPTRYEPSLKGYLVKTEGCKIPEMDADDPSVRGFVFDEKPVRCDRALPPLFESNASAIFLIRKSMRKYSIVEETKFWCQYTPFWRLDPKRNEKDNKVAFGGSVNFTNSAVIQEEFIMVECFYASLSIYKDFFAFVHSPKEAGLGGNDQNPNVLVIGLDSVSRLNFHRQMPKTKSILEKIKAVELLGYNKVGDNTFPNLIPVLTGLSEEGLQRRCWQNSSSHFDDCPFVWNDFKEKGYATAFGEDSTWMGTFNYQKSGFSKQPTDYFWCPFNMIAEKQIGAQHRMNVQQCVGSREVYTTLLEYVTNFALQMRRYRRNYFGFFWQNSLSHDFLNKLKLGDATYANFLKNLFDNQLLNNTILIFLSDHGMRWGAIRTTYQGSIEERLPVIYVYLPENFKSTHPSFYSNLMRNKRRLTTPFDLHETLKQISGTRNQSTSNYSLFDAIPPTRTCDSASIAAHWCTCQESTKLSANDSDAKEIALYTVGYINDLLNSTECYKLRLNEVLDARKHGHSNLTQKHYFEDVTVIVKTLPGEALFESTVRKRYSKGKHTLNVIGTISRINLYGGQSACVTDYHLKLYCYCG